MGKVNKNQRKSTKINEHQPESMKIDAAGSEIDLPASWDRFLGSLGLKQQSKIDCLAPGPETIFLTVAPKIFL